MSFLQVEVRYDGARGFSAASTLKENAAQKKNNEVEVIIEGFMENLLSCQAYWSLFREL